MAQLTPEPRGMPMQEPQMDVLAGISDENLTKEQKEAKEKLASAFIAIKEVSAENNST